MNIERNLIHTATYWEQTGTDIQGSPTFNSGVVLKCRWEDNTELFINKRGQEVASRARVFFSSDISLQGYLFLGVSNEADPRTLTGEDRAYEIQQVKRIPNLRNMQTLYTAFL